MIDFVDASQSRFKPQKVVQPIGACRGCGSDKVEKSVAWGAYRLYGNFYCVSCGHLNGNLEPVE